METLPSELILSICDFLDDKDILCLRWVSCALRNKTSRGFGNRFFQHLQIVLHPASLGMLIDMARRPDIARHVQTISVSPKRFDDDKLSSWVKPMQIDDDDTEYVQILEAFQSFTNLSKVRVDRHAFTQGRYNGPRGNETHAPLRCGHQFLSWNRYINYEVWRWMERETTRAYNLVMRAIDASKIGKTIELGLMLDLEPEDRLELEYFDLHTPSWTNVTSSALTVLRLNGRESTAWRDEILKTAPNLKKLRLGGYSWRGEDFELFDQSFEKFPNWPQLRYLELFKYAFSLDTLVPFLKAHVPALTWLMIDYCGLRDGTWEEPLQVLRTGGQLEGLHLGDLKGDVCGDPTTKDLTVADRWYAYRSEEHRFARLTASHHISLITEELQSDYRTIEDGWMDFRKVRSKVRELVSA